MMIQRLKDFSRLYQGILQLTKEVTKNEVVNSKIKLAHMIVKATECRTPWLRGHQAHLPPLRPRFNPGLGGRMSFS